MSENDEARGIVLKYLYERHRTARSLKSNRASISEIKSDLKKEGLKEQQIIAALDYLIQAKWVKVESDESEFIVPNTGRRISQKKDYYRIADFGIDYFEGPSRYQNIDKSLKGINVTNVGGVTTIGNENVVNVHHVDLYKALDELSGSIRIAASLTDADKLNYVKDIETIKDQLAKPEPDKGILHLAWEKLRPLADIAGIASFFQLTNELIRRLFS